MPDMVSEVRQRIEAASSKVHLVPLPHLGENAYVRRLRIGDYLEFISASEDIEQAERMVELVRLCAADEHGERLYGESDEDMVAVGSLDAVTLATIAQAAAEFNAITGDAVDGAKKNSGEIT